PAVNRTKYFLGVPATNNITKPVGKRTSAEPRSGSLRIKTKGSNIIPIAFQNTSGSRSSSAGRLRKLAWARMNANLANSEGWSRKSGLINHRRAVNKQHAEQHQAA